MHSVRPTTAHYRCTSLSPSVRALSKPRSIALHPRSWASSPELPTLPHASLHVSQKPEKAFLASLPASTYVAYAPAPRHSGLHASGPPKGSGDALHVSDPQPDRDPDRDGDISDQEWEIRTGRAIYILQHTLPDFFETGLVSSLEIPALRRPPSPPSPSSSSKNGKPEAESIYSPNIRLGYTPPVALPAPFPRTLHVEGLHLYMASSAFVRHTLNALYTDLHVELRRVRVHGPRSSSGKGPASPGAEQGPDGAPPGTHTHRSIREKSLFVGLSVSGVARVSGARSGWEVNSTYTFSPLTGLIHLHNIDSIEPVPHQAVFDALHSALTKLGLADGPGRESPGAGAGAARSQGLAHPHAKSG